MKKERLCEKLGRLLDVGEPLLTVFPKKHPDDLWLQLPDTISDDMSRYAYHVALRAEVGRDIYQRYWSQAETTPDLLELIPTCESGLLGWRALGILR